MIEAGAVIMSISGHRPGILATEKRAIRSYQSKCQLSQIPMILKDEKNQSLEYQIPLIPLRYEQGEASSL